MSSRADMSPAGALVAVVGPSGAGKDTVLDAACRAAPWLVRAKRVITRDEDKGGEDHIGVGHEAFDAGLAAGAFLFHWEAHGLRYAVPVSVLAALKEGKTVLFNGSREALPEIMETYPALRVVVITTDRATLSRRLEERGRETAQEIEKAART
ncbi:phosphonate metabolism protein/1,5-bisphosphokinase (PRPP-forming) PhnN [Roseovarius sp. C7]|uniref:phosphonate metabolism protein/1,5-bisphosphokinase (PRPP-forming) PhnN n=1 Tax=Roseovarius sp. C7 TaxID=3398643 RepID=UPI0039F72B0A